MKSLVLNLRLDMRKQPDWAKLFSTSFALGDVMRGCSNGGANIGAVALICDHLAVEAMPTSPLHG
jgi:hypothetical protein